MYNLLWWLKLLVIFSVLCLWLLTWISAIILCVFMTKWICCVGKTYSGSQGKNKIMPLIAIHSEAVGLCWLVLDSKPNIHPAYVTHYLLTHTTNTDTIHYWLWNAVVKLHKVVNITQPNEIQSWRKKRCVGDIYIGVQRTGNINFLSHLLISESPALYGTDVNKTVLWEQHIKIKSSH